MAHKASRSRATKLGIVPDVVILDDELRVKLLIEDKTQTALNRLIPVISGLNASIDWNAVHSAVPARGSVYSSLIKLVAVMLHSKLSFAFLCDATKYCVLQIATNHLGQHVVFLSQFVSVSDPKYPFIPILLSTLLGVDAQTNEVSIALNIPAATLESAATWCTLDADNAFYKSVDPPSHDSGAPSQSGITTHEKVRPTR